MSTEEHFIHDKIAIPAATPRISRPRLLKLLADNLSSTNATVINGRAGTGKTLLAADFARHAERAVAWYKVDATDSDLRLFCEYLVTAMRLQRPLLGAKQLIGLSQAVKTESPELLADALVFQLGETRGEPLLIVIEDLHLVYDAEWVVPFFRRWLPLLPSDAHVLITCRSLPPTPLWRLRSKQMLRVVEESELAFTAAEAVALFETYGLNSEHARVAWAQTSGKAATISDFASTPGKAGRALADNLLFMRRASFSALSQTPDFQT